MTTFLPYADFRRSLECLDRLRLGQQRRETRQILNALFGFTDGYRRHPATVMWEGCTDALCHYGLLACEVWMERGYKDTLYDDIYGFLQCNLNDTYKLPTWLGSTKVHSSHRGRLLEKDAQLYGRNGWSENPRSDYFWPAPSYDWRNQIGDGLDPYHNPEYRARDSGGRDSAVRNASG